MRESEAGKRIVSKSEYVRAQSTRFSIGVFGFFLFVVLCVCVLTTLSCGVCFIAWIFFWNCDWNHTVELEGEMGSLVAFILFMVSSYFLAKLTKSILMDAVNIDPGVPLTRANAADLPAPESLVRASEEPSAPLETVLVRPSVQAPDTPPEQLVRAASANSSGEMVRRD